MLVLITLMSVLGALCYFKPKKSSLNIGNSAPNSGKKLLKCPQCDFMTQNETFFNEHMTNLHSGLPKCPFCFLAFQDYSSLRKHCRTVHAETRNNQTERMDNIQTGGRARDNIPEGRKNIRPCRYFQNGEGKCAPKNGKCDHSIIPFNEREVCFHNQNVSISHSAFFITLRGRMRVTGRQITREQPKYVVILIMVKSV